MKASGVCPHCKGEKERPCCDNSFCEPEPESVGISSCIHCYGELHEVNGFWYHWSQFNSDGTLPADAVVQAVSENKTRPQK